MQSIKTNFLIVLFALIWAGFIYWLNSEFRSEGLLGAIQTLLQPLVFFPYLAGAILGGNSHEPNSAVFFAVLFIQLYAFFLFIRWLKTHRESNNRGI